MLVVAIFEQAKTCYLVANKVRSLERQAKKKLNAS